MPAPEPVTGSTGESGPVAEGSTGMPPPGPAAPPAPEAPGLFEQFGATRESVKRLVGAHIELAKAEFADITDAIKRAAIFIGLAIGAVIFGLLLVAIGTPLFLGELLFGSIGWGVLLGLLLLLAIAVAAGILALDAGRGRGVAWPFLAAAVIGIVVGVVLGLDLTNRAWTALGDAAATGLDPSSRPLVLAAVSLAVIGGVLGLISGAVGGGAGAAIGGLVGGAIAGALLGALTAIATGPRVGAAIGVAAGLIAWIGLMGLDVARRGVDTDELKHRFWPDRTIEVTKETIEWARERMPLSRKS